MMRFAGALLVCFLSLACTPRLDRQAQVDNTFVLDALPAPVHAPDLACPTLEVSAMDASAGFASAQMVYREHQHQLQYFAYNHWADTPTRMLTPLLRRVLQDSAVFAAVVTPSSGVDTALRLDSRLLSLYQDFRETPSVVHLSVAFDLVDRLRGTVLLSRRFAVASPSDTATPFDGVRAANRAVQRLLIEAQDALYAHLRTTGICPGAAANP